MMQKPRLLTFVLAGITSWLCCKTILMADDAFLTVRQQAAKILEKAVRETKTYEHEEKMKSLVQAGNKAVEMLGSSSQIAIRIKSAIEQATLLESKNPLQAAEFLINSISETGKDLSFQPINEAEQPEGFPLPTPVGEIEIKKYPPYRKAQADMPSDRAFWTLFSHIKKENIAMTAPVEIDYGNDRKIELKEQKMSFLYGKPNLGEPGKDKTVDVMDIPAATVVSMGVRGPQNQDSIVDSQRQLEAWLESEKKSWTPAGCLRIMAYNSPFVPQDRNFYEVQIPVLPVESKATKISNER
jgi:hypothetical protein